MINIELLEKKMKEQNITNSEMAKVLNINESTWYRKLKMSKNFKIGEVEKIVKCLKLNGEVAQQIFLI